ncbi:hypothetical protein SAMN05446037_100149 [Anaerovirgula multivorans]|uniref:Uncharacterized protein n=1 Tax=Anaerovirgula multivorans TaxID=312168 RepID=A0A238ZS45_9FIRM|nr:hypothetical protein [Anaerovirgula multivorans]SNR85768.1 hypothetical protein SAMN05446037_100149 [Anaerovirgula multivorans]
MKENLMTPEEVNMFNELCEKVTKRVGDIVQVIHPSWNYDGCLMEDYGGLVAVLRKPSGCSCCSDEEISFDITDTMLYDEDFIANYKQVEKEKADKLKKKKEEAAEQKRLEQEETNKKLYEKLKERYEK